jgi:protein SCO1/2
MGAVFAGARWGWLVPALLLSVSSPAVQAAPQAPGTPQGVGILQQLGSSVTMDLAFRDERGGEVTLREASGGKPFILALVYYQCPMLCNLILGGLLETLIALGPSAGDQFNVVTVSFDPAEGPGLAAAKKAHYLRSYGRPSGERGWRFLTDVSGSAERLCREAGFGIAYDPATRQYAHASAVMIVTPDGRLSRYFMGVSYPARDVRLALVEASAGKIGSVTDQLLLLCFRYDPAAGKYTLAVWTLLRAASVATVLGLILLVAGLARRRLRHGPSPGPAGGGSPAGRA